ncbi:MAG: hypothetical protein PHU25_01575 [Deltaproteobacteria bacterium]|nr:hypothetical protein [Deltaproteobacteria bacterium]
MAKNNLPFPILAALAASLALGTSAAGAEGQATDDKTALDTKCAAIKAKGEELPPECRAAELDIVFQGGISGGTGPQAQALPQATDSETNALHRPEPAITYEGNAVKDAKKEEPPTVWEIAREEPQLFEGEKEGAFAAAVFGGYSLMFGRGADVDRAFDPVVHVGAEVNYQLFPLMKLALVADFEYMTGRDVELTEYIPPPEDPNKTLPRDIGAMIDDYYGIGLRPTVRFNIHLSLVEAFAGFGLGWHYVAASGKWRAKKAENDPANVTATSPSEQPQWSGADEAFYSFELSDSGMYAAMELGALARFWKERLGLGFLVLYTVPMHGGAPSVKVEGGAGQRYDYSETLVRHLGSMTFLTFCLVAEARF